MCRFSIPKKWKSWEVPDVVGFGSFLVTHSETWKLKLHPTLLQSHFESDMIIAWQEWFLFPLCISMKVTWLLPDKSDSVFHCVFQWKWHDYYLTRVIPLSATSCPTLSRIPSTRSQVLQFLLSEGRQSQVWVKNPYCLKISDRVRFEFKFILLENVEQGCEWECEWESERKRWQMKKQRDSSWECENVQEHTFTFTNPCSGRCCFVCFSIASNSEQGPFN